MSTVPNFRRRLDAQRRCPFMKYLSEIERGSFFAEQLRSDNAMNQGIIFPKLGRDPEDAIIRIRGGRSNVSGKEGAAENSAAEEIEFVGYITCGVSQHYPHATDLDWIRVVKAKSSGPCDYWHITGVSPPTIYWELIQILSGPAEAGQIWPRTGLHPRWSDSVAYIATACVSGNWAHGDYMVATLPPGWYFENGASTIYWLMGVVNNYVAC